VRCDVPAHAYQATFAPSTSWSEAYAQGPEILNYWREIADKYDVRKYVRLEHKVISAEWSDEKAKWLIHVSSRDGDFVDEADFLLTATGHFADPKLPDYPGMDKFQGDIFHTSAWKTSFEPKDKNIAVIGNGASGIQVLPQLQKVARRIDHYARNPTWVAAPIGGEKLEDYVAEGIEKARLSPENYLEFRKGLENKLFSRFGSIFKGSDKNATTREGIEKLMASRLVGKPELVKQMIPEFSPSCRRLTPGPGYLEALTADNVAYITEGITEFTEKGIRSSDGKKVSLIPSIRVDSNCF
jgi:cation diffusion facilitator CzcD-associated flavoprotein CzcO